MQHIASSNSAVYSEEMNLEQAPTFGTYSDSGFDSDAGQTFVLPFWEQCVERGLPPHMWACQLPWCTGE